MTTKKLMGCVLIGVALAVLVYALVGSSSAAEEAPVVVPPTAPSEATGRPQRPACTKVRHSAWNKLVAREIAADGKAKERRRKTSVCLREYNRFKHHVRKVERANCVPGGVICWIKKAARKYGQPVGDAIRVATCESGLDPSLVNTPSNPASATGLFQFLPSTWQTTPYARRDIFSAKWNALAAMWMWSVGRRSEWVCQ